MRYASLNAHQGYTQSRRDDLEAIGNIIVYFMRSGDLPWMAAEIGGDKKADTAHHDQSDKEQLKLKENTTIEQLCEGLPPCIY